MKKRLKAFTLIEVIAALGVIIVLTLALVLTIRSQIQKVDQQQLQATIAAVNTQIVVEYEQPERVDGRFNDIDALRKADIITEAQLKILTKGKAKLAGTPPQFSLP